MDLDFLEIGTSDFNTLLQHAELTDIGMSVEPVRYYLDRLPNKNNVQKVNCAISPTNTEGDIEVFYLTVETIRKHNLPKWFKGCSNIGKIHPTILKYNMQDYVDSYIVKQYPISTFLDLHNIKNIKFLKIDTEGNDCDILKHYAKYLERTKLFPNKIQFESNVLTPPEKVVDIIKIYSELGYVSHTHKIDTILTRT